MRLQNVLLQHVCFLHFRKVWFKMKLIIKRLQLKVMKNNNCEVYTLHWPVSKPHWRKKKKPNRELLFQQKMATNNWNKSYFELNRSSDKRSWLSHRGSLGASSEQHIVPRAAGSHFLPGAPPKWPIVTPEELAEEVITGQLHCIGNTVIRWPGSFLMMALCFFPQHMILITINVEWANTRSKMNYKQILFNFSEGEVEVTECTNWYLLKGPWTNASAACELVNIPRLFLQNKMGLHKELDPQPQPTGCHIIHLLADTIPQIEPQVLSFAAGELQPKVVHFNYAQLSANLEGDERNMEVREEDFIQRKFKKVTVWKTASWGHKTKGLQTL